MSLALNTHIIFIYSIGCLHLPIFRSQAALISEIYTVSSFHKERPKLQNLTLPHNRSRSTQGHHDGPESQMFHINFRGNRSTGSREDF